MTRHIAIACLLAGLCTLPCCKDKQSGQSHPGTEAGRPMQAKQPSPADRKFLGKLQALPRTPEEKKVERWTSLGVTVESGWVVDMSPDELVIEHTDITKKELAQHYLDKLDASGWKQTDYDGSDDVFVHTLERGDVALTVTGKDRQEGGATITIRLPASASTN